MALTAADGTGRRAAMPRADEVTLPLSGTGGIFLSSNRISHKAPNYFTATGANVSCCASVTESKRGEKRKVVWSDE